jgi:hypothetical protein
MQRINHDVEATNGSKGHVMIGALDHSFTNKPSWKYTFENRVALIDPRPLSRKATGRPAQVLRPNEVNPVTTCGQLGGKWVQCRVPSD